MSATLALVSFISGAAFEAACVGWVHYSERRRPIITALFSMVAALAEVTGVGESIHDWHYAPLFILGYGFGTFAAVELKRRTSTMRRASPSTVGRAKPVRLPPPENNRWAGHGVEVHFGNSLSFYDAWPAPDVGIERACRVGRRTRRAASPTRPHASTSTRGTFGTGRRSRCSGSLLDKSDPT